MGAIYANASVTIMAVKGERDNSGLREFRGLSEPRKLRQVVHVLANEVRRNLVPDRAKTITSRRANIPFTPPEAGHTRSW